MAEKQRVESANAGDLSDPVPIPRAGEPEPAGDRPAKAATPSKATKAAKATKQAKAAKAAKASTSTKAAKKATTAAKKTGTAAKKAQKRATKVTTQAAAPSAEPPAEPAATPLVPEPPAPAEPAPLAPGRPGAWVAAIRDAVSRPNQPPQRLAELVVAELGPRAAAWANWLRATYPDPPAYGIVRLAAHEAGQLSRVLALAEATGQAATPLFMSGMVWVRATVVLRIAAAYGHDPADPRRAGDLIQLLGLYTDDESPWLRRLRLVTFATAPIAVRRKPVPAALRALLVDSTRHERIERLAHRAARFYHPGGQGSQDKMSASSASISSPYKP